MVGDATTAGEFQTLLLRCNGMGSDLFVDAAESASFPLPGTGKREGGEKTQPLQHFLSHLGTYRFATHVPTDLYNAYHRILVPECIFCVTMSPTQQLDPRIYQMPDIPRVRCGIGKSWPLRRVAIKFGQPWDRLVCTKSLGTNVPMQPLPTKINKLAFGLARIYL